MVELGGFHCCILFAVLFSGATTGLTGLIVKRLREDGEIEQEPSPNFLARNWPMALTEWPTKAVREAFFASPVFPRLTDPEVLRRTIAKGISEGLFGYAGKDAAGSYVGFRYKRPTTEAEVELSDTVVLIPQAAAETQSKGNQRPNGQGNGAQTPGTSSPPTTSTPPRPEAQTADSPKAGRLKRLIWEGEIPLLRWTQFYTKVLTRFAVGGGVKLIVRAEIAPAEGVSAQDKTEVDAALKDLGLGGESSAQ